VKVLFYLPIVTPWWFDNVVEPLIRRLVDIADVTVLAPEPWSDTGIGKRELARCVDLPQVRWCIMDGADHPSTRTRPKAKADIIAFVRDLAPDYVFCRSADCETVRKFPGQVRFLMEGGLAPFPLPNHWIMMQDQPLDHALLPSLDEGAKAVLSDMIAPAWARLRAQHAGSDRRAVLGRLGVPSDRPVLLLPLEYEHRENFFLMHRIGPRPNYLLVQEVAKSIGPDFLLAVTNHPLNELYVDNEPLEAAMAELAPNAILLPPTIDGQSSTLALAPHVDGMIVGDSKSYGAAAFCGTPIFRRSQFRMGGWVSAYADLPGFLNAVAAGNARRAAEDDARLWSAFHLANNVFDPQDPDLEPEEILDRAAVPVAPARWPAGLARLRTLAPELFQ
jgi:hypothetical protein